MKIERFDPPANVLDFDTIDNMRNAWSEFLSFVFDREVLRLQAAYKAGAGGGTPAAYYSYDDFDGQVFSTTTGATGSLEMLVRLYNELLRRTDIVVDDVVFGDDVYDLPASDPKRVRIFRKGEYNAWNDFNTAK